MRLPIRHFLPRSLRRLINHATCLGALVCVSVACAMSGPSAAQTSPSSVSDAMVEALFLYNFAKFVDWPEHVFASKQAPITLCIYGDKPGEIRQSIGAVENKLAQGREIKVKRSVGLSELAGCQVVFIPELERRWLSEVLRVAHQANALTVSDMDAFIDAGGGIGLFMIDNQMRFECNLDATQSAGLKLSAQLLKLARVVKGQGGRN